MTRFFACWTLALSLAACDPGGGDDDAGTPMTDAGPADAGEPDAGPFEPDSFCPGAPGCETGSGGGLEVGAAAVPITPTIDDTTDVQTVDVDGDGEFDASDGDEFADRDGERGFQGVWIAGFGNARAATGVHDETWARAVAMRNGDTTLVLLVLDVVGWFKSDMEPIREMVADLDVDHIAISATHTHQSRDTIGIWGLTQDRSGVSDAYNAFVQAQAAQAVRDAIGALRPANAQYASVDLRDRPEGPVQRWVGDLRDPIILDPEMRVVRFVEAGGDATIATVVNFGAHAEYLDDANTLISSDWPHWLRQGVEDGVTAPDGSAVDGLGGVTVLVQSAIGSQIGPNGLSVETWDGTPLAQDDDVYVWTQTVGEQLAYFVLEALGDGGGSVTDETADLGYRTRSFYVTVQNTGFHVAITQRLFHRDGENWDPDAPIIPGENEPELRAEVTVLDVGRAQWITVPGELDPQIFLGGYDGSYTPDGVPMVDPDNPNPPDLSMAPDGPYLRDLARPDAEQVWLLGLTNDYLGYFIPEYNYVLDESTPYLAEAEGDHYEETNSVGIDGWPTIRRELEALLAWAPDGG